MNKIDQTPDYKTIYKKACRIFLHTKDFWWGTYDETFFTLRVYKEAKGLISKIKKPVNKQAILTAALLHDIGKSSLDRRKMFGKRDHLKHINDEWYRHAAISAKIAKKILLDLGHSKEFTDLVCYLISKHDSRKMPMKEKSIELMILQDADIIADIGISGFIRPYTFSGRYKRSIVDTIQYQKDIDYYKDPKFIINLKISKKIIFAKLKTQFQLENMIKKEMECDLI